MSRSCRAGVADQFGVVSPRQRPGRKLTRLERHTEQRLPRTRNRRLRPKHAGFKREFRPPGPPACAGPHRRLIGRRHRRHRTVRRHPHRPQIAGRQHPTGGHRPGDSASTSCFAPADSAADAATAAPTATNTSPRPPTPHGRRLPAGDSRGGFDDLKPLLFAAGVDPICLMSPSPSACSPDYCSLTACNSSTRTGVEPSPSTPATPHRSHRNRPRSPPTPPAPTTQKRRPAPTPTTAHSGAHNPTPHPAAPDPTPGRHPGTPPAPTHPPDQTTPTPPAPSPSPDSDPPPPTPTAPTANRRPATATSQTRPPSRPHHPHPGRGL